MPVCLIGLGSNIGDRQANLEVAVSRLAAHAEIEVLAVSAWRETAPIGGPAHQPAFLNGALRLETRLGPHELLAVLQRIETGLGRVREEAWGPRTIDLDLLLFDGLTLNTPSLVVPHPRMAWRRFVIESAAEVAGAMTHPMIGWTVARLLEHLDTARPYLAITGPIAAGKTRLARRLAAAIGARLIVERPDWPRLRTFYADPASHAWQTELKFLGQRADLLDPDSAAWSAPEKGKSGTVPFFRWVVSDFWFDQSAAFARAWLSDEQLPAFLEQYERVRREVVQPKLTVLLDAPTDQLLSRIRSRGRSCERPLTAERLARIGRAMQEQAGQPQLGPVLRACGDAEAVFAEVLAAVRGME